MNVSEINASVTASDKNKLDIFLKMAISTPKKVRFRDVMSKKGII